MDVERPRPFVHVIVPARNEQDCIGRCLESLVRQQGIDFRITVVDDGSTDQTHAIAQSFPGVEVISAADVVSGAAGKCDAMICVAQGSRAEWLLFTDADTVHYPGSLAASVHEAKNRGVDLLSYSPEQETIAWSEKVLQPLVFAELMRAFPLDRVSDTGDSLAAANGQYILVLREAYEKVGGHGSVSNQLLDDVELARLFKRAGYKIWFGYGGGLVRTRMYRSFSAMLEGWTKNLALLFAHTARLALVRTIEFILVLGAIVAAVGFALNQQYEVSAACLAAGAVAGVNFCLRIRSAHFGWRYVLLAFFGLPLFAWVLLRSYIHLHVRGAVVWKGRTYRHSESSPEVRSSIQDKEFQRFL
jgi:glycosyltransferase involved in cell wall biosynthesis